MAKVGPKKLRIKHDAILDFMIANPAVRQADVAEHFGVTQAWLSCIVNSDAFQAKLKERQDEVFEKNVLPVHQRVLGLAGLAVEKMEEALEVVDPVADRKYVLDATELALKAAGLTGQKLPSGQVAMQQNNYFLADADALAQAREAMRQVHSVTPEAPALPKQEKALEGEAELVGAAGGGEPEPAKPAPKRAPAAVTISCKRPD